MKPAVSLYEFMPYGAPELLEARRADLSRALFLTSLLAIAMLATVGAVWPRLPRRLPTVVQFPVPGTIHDVARPPQVRPEPPALVPVSPAPGNVSGIPVPVISVRDLVPSTIPATGEGTTPADPQPASRDFSGTAASAAEPTVDPELPVTVVEELPEAVRQVEPVYPEMGRQAETEGLVVVFVLVGRDGRVREARVDPNRHVLLLDDAALDAARQWVFRPAQVNGHPVATWSSIPFRFRLH